MDARTLEALKASIAKWERNVEAETPDTASINVAGCPLCGLFWSRDEDETCVGCPIRNFTGKSYCDETPYDDAHAANDKWHEAIDNEDGVEAVAVCRHEWRRAAQAEVDFLRSLLPAEAA